jgi:hypothetical protein
MESALKKNSRKREIQHFPCEKRLKLDGDSGTNDGRKEEEIETLFAT